MNMLKYAIIKYKNEYFNKIFIALKNNIIEVI